jgi:hypothetical protein
MCPRRSKRQMIPKSFRDDFIIYIIDDTPETISESLTYHDTDDLKKDIHSELDSIISN